jgi:UPF0755 protein
LTETPDTTENSGSQADAAKTAQPEAVSSAKKPKRFLKWLLVSFMLICVLGAGALGGTFYYAKDQYERAGPASQDLTVQFKRGTSLIAIARKLENAGAITDARIFRFGIQLQKGQGALKAGEYNIPAAASMAEIFALLKSGKSILHIQANPILTGDLPAMPPEGSLLPETYLFERGMTRTELVTQMRTALTAELDKQWAARAENLPLNSPQEALILASIVEKETGLAAERPQVASVFINRLRRPMRLQSDPTIIYGITLGKTTLGRGLRRSEIDRKTPYNTYQIDGLPPTPIALVGPDAIHAVLNPPTSKFYYFVADGTGGHVFATSLREHEKNVRNWRKIERQRK